MTFSRRPSLLATSHGTSDPSGQAAVINLVRSVAHAMPKTAVQGGYVDVQQPDVATSLELVGDDSPVIIVPLLLSAGYHVRVDLAHAAREAAPRFVTVTGALGPDPRLTQLLAQRLREAGAVGEDSVVIAAAGSTDGQAVEDCRAVARALSVALGKPVTVGFLSAAEPTLADAVTAARHTAPAARVVIASYLLAPGYFAGLTHAVGADLVTNPLLAHGEEPPRQLVDVIIDRYSAMALAM